MINSDSINLCIRERKSFILGQRGIAIRCDPHDYNNGWTVSVDRASIFLDVDEISILDDVDFYHLCISFDSGYSFESFADLSFYEKLTVIE